MLCAALWGPQNQQATLRRLPLPCHTSLTFPAMPGPFLAPGWPGLLAMGPPGFPTRADTAECGSGQMKGLISPHGQSIQQPWQDRVALALVPLVAELLPEHLSFLRKEPVGSTLYPALHPSWCLFGIIGQKLRQADHLCRVEQSPWWGTQMPGRVGCFGGYAPGSFGISSSPAASVRPCLLTASSSHLLSVGFLPL
jgi:hypothetical protein